MRQHGLSAADLETALNERSGLLGVSEVSADLRQVLAAAEAGNTLAQLAEGGLLLRTSSSPNEASI
jgi:acetate kinase